MQSIRTIFYVVRAREKQKVEEGDRRLERWGRKRRRRKRKASRQMLNGACKYRERRDTKGAPKRSVVRVRRTKAGWSERGGDVRGRFIVCRARRTARGGTLQEKKDRKGVGGSTKGCFNRLLSSVAEQEEEKVTPPVRNYLADCGE